MAKYFNPRKIIAWIVLLAFTSWFFYAEIRLIINPFINQFTNTVEVQIENDKSFRYTPDYSFETEIFLKNVESQNIDEDRSYILLFGSKQSFNENPKSNVIFLESASVIEKIPFSDERIVDTDSGFVFKNDKPVNDATTVLVEVEIHTLDGSKGFNSQLVTNHKLGMDLFYGRYSYYIQYLFWFIAIFGTAARGITWSTVYNSKTKRPLGNAIVRVFKDGEMYNTFVTGPTGTIQLKLPKGEYKLHVARTDYQFPSRLAPLRSDGEYRNLYYGGVFKIYRDNSTMKLNIPLDSLKEGQEYTFRDSVLLIGSSITDSFNRPLLLLLFVIQVAMWPTYLESWLTGVVSLLLILMQYILRYLTTKRRGIVLNESGNPMPDIKVSVHDVDWRKEIKSTQTDGNGEYEFIMPKGDYLLSVDDYNFEVDTESTYERINDSKSLLNIRNSTYINKKLILRSKTKKAIQ